MTAWHLAATSGNSETLKKNWQIAEHILVTEEFK